MGPDAYQESSDLQTSAVPPARRRHPYTPPTLREFADALELTRSAAARAFGTDLAPLRMPAAPQRAARLLLK
jgi:hypothetical protein